MLIQCVPFFNLTIEIFETVRIDRSSLVIQGSQIRGDKSSKLIVVYLLGKKSKVG